jgi:LuxR family transcriptional regulator, maltose regulon positive regulatory protein
MTMTFSRHDSNSPSGASEYLDNIEDTPAIWSESGVASRDEFHLLRDKLKVPVLKSIVQRPRINDLLRKSVRQFPATLISGRAGTGKTVIAADFAAHNNDISWYTVESTDIQWPTFSRYFLAALSEKPNARPHYKPRAADDANIDQTEIARLLLRAFSRKYAPQDRGPSLIVLDDIHHIFDALWFEDFFNLLLYSLPSETHLLLLCRSKPPGPLWRLRSKQMLNVLDEKVIAFNLDETRALFDTLGHSSACASEANRSCFGRVSKLLQFAPA